LTVPVRSKAIEALNEAEQLLHDLPPLSPDHETVRLAIARLQRTQHDLSNSRRFTGSCLARSRDTVEQARSVIRQVREDRMRQRQRPLRRAEADAETIARPAMASFGELPADGHAPATESDADRGVAIFLDLDTVLLATHRGKYGPELALQGNIEEPLERLAETAGALIVVVNPPERDAPHAQDTDNRLRALRDGLGPQADRLVIVTCPHTRDDACQCAKPGSGLIELALEDLALSADGGWYVCGDQQGVVSGRTAGLKTVRIGPAGDDRLSAIHRADYEARDLLDASNHIMYEALAL
jgi:D-glycero-D-manno-heptose 1,7-bisphosphate phosphatase